MGSIVPQNLTPDQVAEQVAMLDTAEAFDAVAMHRWVTAAADGQWTAEEFESAVRWLNLNHAGYTKIAHVHKRILRERELLRAAKALSYEHPDVIKALGYDSPRAAEDAHNRDIIGWNQDQGERAWPMLTRAEWIAWMERDRDDRLTSLRAAFAGPQ
jgi:hypothetical protein